MKVCIAEAMKLIKDLEEEKERLVYSESRRCTVSYKEGEEKVLPDYDYQETRTRIAEIDCEVRRIKYIISKANCEVMLDGFDVSICEGLILLAQYRKECDRLARLAARDQKTRRITPNGVLEYTECLYDVKTAEKAQKDLNTTIGKLQVAIDRANLVSEIEL
ncbi:MAG: hypothetical protein J6K86_00155 [Clostridia bacterium]|nr:hypothetical protein [Clostridia bacterium]